MELVGGHCQIVDELESRFEVICDPTVERTVQVVVLRGVSGSGKSRIIREFYRRLRARRQDSYWPELPESSADDPLVYRKVVAPPLESMVWAADALPSFCWWGFRCDRRAEPEVSSHLLEDIQAQFRVHGLPLTMARQRVRSVGQAAAEQWQGLVQHVRALVRDEVSDQALSALSGLVGEVPGLGLLSRSLFRVGSVARQRWVERRRLHEEELLGDDYLASLSVSSRDLARNLLALALPGLPAVVAVEDGHWLDQSFADFLEVLAERQARRPVMVIVTDWPEGYSAPVYRPWLDRLVAARRATVLQVPDLSVDDRARLVGQVVPGAGGGLALKAARRAANPLLLLGWLAQDSVRRRLAGAAPEVEDELVGSMPAQLADMYRERWQALPATVQADLVVAVASSSDEDALARFIPPVVADASQRVLGLDQSRMTQSLDEAVQAAWCLRSEHLEWLREEPMAALLRQPGVWQPVLTAPEREELRAEVAQAAARYLERHPVVDAIEQSPEQRLAARLSADIVNFDTAPDAYAAQAILSRYLTARQWARGYDYRRAVALMQPVAKRLSTLTDPGSLHIRHQVAYWTGETGDPHTALKLATALLPDRERVLGPTHPETLRTRHNIASWTAETGDPHTALKLATALLPDMTRVLGPTHPDTLTTRHNISRGLWADAALTWSFPEAELAGLSEQIPVLDPETGGRPAYRWARSSSAALDRALAELTELDEAGDAQAVKERFACLLRRTGGYLPPDHPFHLRLRAAWYEWLGEEEDPEQAVTGYANLCQRTQSWPLDHPIRTLVRRSSAWWLAQTGSFLEALAAIDRLSRNLASVSTPTDPELIETRRVRAIILGESGDRPGAAEALRELLRTCAGHEELAPAAAEIRANLDYWDSPDP